MSSPQQAIYLVLRQIPHGKVVSYGQVAELAGLGRAARLVGRTLKNLPEDSDLPWHRVINSQGKISFPADSDAFHRQVSRLQAEGINVNAGRISMRQYRWNPL